MRFTRGFELKTTFVCFQNLAITLEMHFVKKFTPAPSYG